MKKIVVYFSCTGYTKKMANTIKDKLNLDIFEIVPKTLYTEEDLNWMNKESRSSIEMSDMNSRPEILNKIDNIDEYDTIFIGYPIWWGKAPTIINTFLESYNLENKTIIPFATYHSSGIGESDKYLKPSCLNSNYVNATGFQMEDYDSLNNWIKKYE